MDDHPRYKLSELLFGGLGGAIAGSLLAILFSIYFDSVKNVERISAKEEIIEAKNQVVKSIEELRREERLYIRESMESLYNAKLESELAVKSAKNAVESAEKALTTVKKHQEIIEKSIKEGAGINADEVANILKPKVIQELKSYMPIKAIVAFSIERVSARLDSI